MSEFRFLQNSFSIKVPSNFTIVATSNCDFEKNDKFLYNAEILSEDSLSSIFITVENFGRHNISGNNVLESFTRIRTRINEDPIKY